MNENGYQPNGMGQQPMNQGGMQPPMDQGMSGMNNMQQPMGGMQQPMGGGMPPMGGMQPQYGMPMNNGPKKNNMVAIVGVVLVVVAVVVAVLFLGGKKTLECKAEEMGAKVNYIVVYKNKKPSSLEIKFEMDLEDEYDDSIDEVKKYFEKQGEEYEDYGFKTKFSTKKPKVMFTMTGDKKSVKKMADEEDMEIESIDDAKDALEDQGFSCKVK